MMIPGARLIKTGIAVVITVFICNQLGLQPAMFGAVSAVMNLQPSIRLTFQTAREQLIVHGLGVLVAFAVGFSLGASTLSMGLMVMIIIWLYSRLKLHHGILMGIVAAMFVISSAPEQFVSHALTRTLVIFIGLSVASVINIVLFRPRYEDSLVAKLTEANQEAVNFFTATIRAFSSTDYSYFDRCREEFDRVMGLLAESYKLAELHVHEQADLTKLDDDSKPYAMIRFIEYNRTMAEKAWEVCETMKARNQRRSLHGNPPISKDFQEILNMLLQGCLTIERINGKLQGAICQGLSVEPEPFIESFWEELKEALEQWQQQNSGSYYLHALLDISVVAANMRWVARHGKELLYKEAETHHRQKTR